MYAIAICFRMYAYAYDYSELPAVHLYTAMVVILMLLTMMLLLNDSVSTQHSR